MMVADGGGNREGGGEIGGRGKGWCWRVKKKR